MLDQKILLRLKILIQPEIVILRRIMEQEILIRVTQKIIQVPEILEMEGDKK